MVRKAIITPDPGPSSTRKGAGDEYLVTLVSEVVAKCAWSHVVSDGEESVSRNKYESSAGS